MWVVLLVRRQLLLLVFNDNVRNVGGGLGQNTRQDLLPLRGQRDAIFTTALCYRAEGCNFHNSSMLQGRGMEFSQQLYATFFIMLNELYFKHIFN